LRRWGLKGRMSSPFVKYRLERFPSFSPAACLTGAHFGRVDLLRLAGFGFRLRLVCRRLQFRRRLFGLLGCSFPFVGRFARESGIQLIRLRARFRGCDCSGLSSGLEISLGLRRGFCLGSFLRVPLDPKSFAPDSRSRIRLLSGGVTVGLYPRPARGERPL
jgi:hypothetical protein